MSSHRAERRRDRKRSCAGKIAYADLKAAKVAAMVLLRRTGDHCRAYPCRHCSGFHIGHPRPGFV